MAASAFAKHLVRPIQTFLRAIERVGHGDFSTFVEVRTHDEFYDLSIAFNKMIEDLKHYSAVRVDELLNEKVKTEGIIYSSEDGILLMDHQGQIQIINPKARDILDLGETSREALSGRPIWSFIKDDRMAVALRESVEDPSPRAMREVNLSSEGLLRYYTFSVLHIDPPHDADCNEWSVIFLRNVTAEKELNKLKDDFLQSLTHDLRSPMTAVKGYLQVLLDEMAGPVTEQQRKMLKVMENASTKLLHIISNLLDSAKMSAGKFRLSLAECELRRLIPATVEILHQESVKKKITLTLEMPDQMSPIKIDSQLIERVLINLIGNALKFTPDGGFVTVKFVEFLEKIQCQVIDTGPGIPADEMGRLFHKFEQVKGTRGGTGLGLANCKYIIEAHLGDISVKSKLGEGSTFTFTLPKNLEQNEQGDIFKIRPNPIQKAA